MAYSEEGLSKLADIVRAVRGGSSVRQFAKKIGASYRTIERIEKLQVYTPENDTLEKICKVSGHSLDDLIAILKGEKKSVRKEFAIAEDVYAVVDQLSDFEAARVGQYIFERLKRGQSVDK